MNVWGHLQAIKQLGRHRDFWEAISNTAFQKRFLTEQRICQNFVKGEEHKIAWHRKEINSLKDKKETSKPRNNQKQDVSLKG